MHHRTGLHEAYLCYSFFVAVTLHYCTDSLERSFTILYPRSRGAAMADGQIASYASDAPVGQDIPQQIGDR